MSFFKPYVVPIDKKLCGKKESVEKIEDSAFYHTSKKMCKVHELLEVKPVEWSSHSPDFYTIENMWHLLKLKVNLNSAIFV